MPRFRVELTKEREKIAEAQRFRGLYFRGGALDFDEFDEIAIHGLLRKSEDDALVAVFRMLPVLDTSSFFQSYSARFYDLTQLSRFAPTSLELGRFCIDPKYRLDPDVMRLAWAYITKTVLEREISLLFGCSSFAGTAPKPYEDAFRLLAARHLLPESHQIAPKAPRRYEFASNLSVDDINIAKAHREMPPLLRSYLLLGGYVSDHAVIDDDLSTLHVFTCVDVAQIPPARRRFFVDMADKA